MAEVTTAVCDGTPSYVEEHLDEFVETVGRYGPLSARLVSVDVLLEDSRDAEPRILASDEGRSFGYPAGWDGVRKDYAGARGWQGSDL